MKNYIQTLLICLFVYIVDCYTKFLAKKFLLDWDVDFLLWMKLSFAFNKGIAFSIPIQWVIQILLSFSLIIALLFYAIKYWNFDKILAKLSIWFILGWAFWNLYERIFYWEVTDFILVFHWFPVFNFADMFIFIWVMFVLLFEWIYMKK